MTMFDTFDRTGTVDYPFPAPVVLRAVVTAVGDIRGMAIQEVNELAGHVYVKTGMSALSWGEKVTISVLDGGPGRSRVQIASGAKTIAGSATTHGRNRKNVQQIISAASHVLEQKGALWTQEMGLAPIPEAIPAQRSVADELQKLAELHAGGLLSLDEFESQKQRLLG
jgi:hypothetical protein